MKKSLEKFIHFMTLKTIKFITSVIFWAVLFLFAFKFIFKIILFYLMKYFKWIWLVSVLFFTGYLINNYFKTGFDDVGFATWVALVFSGLGLIKKK